MKKFLKISLVSFLIVFIVLSVTTAVVFLTPPTVKFDDKKLLNNQDIEILDKNGIKITELKKGKNYVNLEDIPKHTLNAFISSEDKNFFSHHGIDYRRIIGAGLANLKSMSFSQGGSTISQQLIKNTHLKNEKTLSRKINEIKLTRILEKNYSKNQILEMYLNTIYFGENCYGLFDASQKYFSKDPSDLSIGESALLASIIKAPSKYNPIRNLSLANKNKNVVLDRMYKENYIDYENVKKLKNEDITLNINKDYVTCNSYLTEVYNELDNIFLGREYLMKNLKIYTSFDSEIQNIISKEKMSETDYTAICLDNETLSVTALFSNQGLIKRCPASTVKPWLIYAPCLEEGIINQYTKINDERTDFNGYSPKNFNDSYNGQVSARYALSNSLNVPAVKLLNTLTVDKAKNYSKLMDIDIKSNSLGIALGALENDMSIIDIANCYSVFPNYGIYKKAHFINKITDASGKTIYSFNQINRKVFSEGTATIINDMLKDCSTQGTAKKLKKLNFDVYAKTGTNGDDNGNKDAYSVCYTSDKTFAVWNGFYNGDYMPNSITGGKQPTTQIFNILSNVYKEKKPKALEYKSVLELKFDKYSYETNNEFYLTDDNTPYKYRICGLFTEKNRPEKVTTVFKKPILNNAIITLDNDTVNIKYELNKLYGFLITRILRGEETTVYDGKEAFCEKLEKEGVYQYFVTPYISIGNEKIFGDKYKLPEINYTKQKDKTLPPDDWWFDFANSKSKISKQIKNLNSVHSRDIVS